MAGFSFSSQAATGEKTTKRCSHKARSRKVSRSVFGSQSNTFLEVLEGSSLPLCEVSGFDKDWMGSHQKSAHFSGWLLLFSGNQARMPEQVRKP